jgi:hypothetical protein
VRLAAVNGSSKGELGLGWQEVDVLTFLFDLFLDRVGDHPRRYKRLDFLVIAGMKDGIDVVIIYPFSYQSFNRSAKQLAIFNHVVDSFPWTFLYIIKELVLSTTCEEA